MMRKYSRELLKEKLGISRKKYGSKDLRTIQLMQKLANYYRLSGQYKEAKEWLRKILTLQKEIVGEVEPETLKTTLLLAECCKALGQYEQVKEYYERGVEVSKLLTGDKSLRTISTMYSLAETMRAMGLYYEANNILIKIPYLCSMCEDLSYDCRRRYCEKTYRTIDSLVEGIFEQDF